ncbi:hypothetical protein LC040_01840 [Bacillus tianshenii]|nr:hypothetical protein LC040_01840 [Bacillus tianshenii]
MLTLTSLDELKEVDQALHSFQQSNPALYEQYIHVLNLTRQMQFKFHYMGSLLMNEETNESAPQHVNSSVLRLYEEEVQNLHNEQGIDSLKEIFNSYRHAGYAKISLLSLGADPDSLVGATVIR